MPDLMTAQDMATKLKAARQAAEESDTEARFTEGPEGKKEFAAWIKSQPQSVQDEWAENTDKYKDKFDKKGAGRNTTVDPDLWYVMSDSGDLTCGPYRNKRDAGRAADEMIQWLDMDFMVDSGKRILWGMTRPAADIFITSPSGAARMVQRERDRLGNDRFAGAGSDDEKAQGAEERAEADQEKAQAERSEAEADRSDAASKEAGVRVAYHTVVLPPGATKWQSPRKTLTRGAFNTEREAHAWAKKNVPDESYKVKEIKDVLPTKVAGKEEPGVQDGTGPNPDCPKKDKEAGFHRERLTWGREAAVTPTGMYGVTKADQRDCEASIRKVQRQAMKIARVATKKDPRVAAFILTHSKRASSLPAKILVAALQELQPKLASTDKRGMDSDQEILYDALMLIAENDGDSYRKQDAKGAVEKAFQGYQRTKQDDLRDDFKAIKKKLSNTLGQEWKKTAMAKEASRGLYGFRSKTAVLGLNACSEIRGFTGTTAYGLHTRRSTRYANITGFFKAHGKEAKCKYSRMLLSAYPDPAGKTASDPETVEDWISWE